MSHHHTYEYDLDTYHPIVTAPEGGWTYEDRDQLQREASTRNYLVFARTKGGKVWQISRPPFNEKSIKLQDSRVTHSTRQRLRYEELESLGSCQLKDDAETEAEEPPLEPIKDEIRNLQSKLGDNAVTVSMIPAPGGGDPDRPGMLIERAARELEAESSPAHAGRDHALLSASGANRWINCPPSAILETRYPDTESDAAAEGTAAHELAEYKLCQLYDLPVGERPESEWWDEDMESHTDDYADRVMAELAAAQAECRSAFLAVEQRLDFSHIVPDGFGTGDSVIVGDGLITVIDFKYGKGVPVSAEGNPQMRLYALGALAEYGMIYPIKRVRMVIFQPRLDNISVDEITVDELLAWAETVVRPAAELAARGEGELKAGEWCQFCRHAPQCTARAAELFAPIPMDEAEHVPAAPDPDTLTDEQIAQIITHAGELKKWLTKVEEHALARAADGHTYPGLKVVEGRSVRRYTDEGTVAHIVEEDTEHSPYKPREVLGITAMTKLLGKKKFDELLGDYVHKPEGKPTLVPESDKRPALELTRAEDVFTPIEKGA